MKIKRAVHGLAIIVCSLFAFTSGAAVIPSDLNLNGSVSFDTANSLPFTGTGSQTASMTSVSGGVGASSSVNNVTVTGSNPLNAIFTETGDGVGVSASMNGGSGAEADDFIFDIGFNLSNTSLLDSYIISFEIAFATAADADSQIANGDAFVDSEINFFDSANTEFFFSDLTSDVSFGDEQNGTSTGSFGAALSDSGTYTFDILLGAGASDSFTGLIKMDGGEFAGAGAFLASAEAFVSITNVIRNTTSTPISEPPLFIAFVLFLITVIYRNQSTLETRTSHETM
ncbi:hypothetical protein OE749_10560 [Aestuariibacter sp. AA17]|uniref:PEP-CTERM protein-sorting domain-containing protein n=1 Tax=Fluctibacter corallii TaxID=2984329 RepID=A0ABT3A932_9ALTE|nr:hypothetical protein [Aestuariibacter sp. AA17]MCV2885133.1 hypothetical protein [Aestuariibacter sp. AA17]